MAALSHVFTVATNEWGWVAASPVRRVRRPTEPRGRVQFLDAEERTALLGACEASSEPRLLPLVVLAISTRARQAELMNLRWSDLDLPGRGAVVQDTKNSDRRRLTLAGRALEIVRELVAHPCLGGRPHRPWLAEFSGFNRSCYHDFLKEEL